MGMFDLDPKLAEVAKQTKEDFINAYNEFATAYDDDSLTICVQKDENEYRCSKCDQRIGREQVSCFGCKRKVAFHTNTDAYDFFKQLKDNNVNVEKVHVSVTQYKKRTPLYYVGFFALLWSVSHIVDWIVKMFGYPGIY